MYADEDLYNELVAASSERHGVPPWVIKTVIATESAFDPKAFRADPAIDDARRGLMLISERMARVTGYESDPGDDALRVGGLYEPPTNIECGTRLLARFMKKIEDRESIEAADPDGKLHGVFPWDEVYAAYHLGSQLEDLKRLLNAVHVERWRRVAQISASGKTSLVAGRRES